MLTMNYSRNSYPRISDVEALQRTDMEVFSSHEGGTWHEWPRGRKISSIHIQNTAWPRGPSGFHIQNTAWSSGPSGFQRPFVTKIVAILRGEPWMDLCIHSIRFANGEEWDTINGYRKKLSPAKKLPPVAPQFLCLSFILNPETQDD